MNPQTPPGFRQSEHTDSTFTVHAEVPVRQDVSEQIALAQELGLGDCYVDKFVHGTFTDRKRWQHCRLSLDEWLVVQCYFPKCYGFEGDALHTFAFQELPEPVLRIWKEAKESGFFAHFQLRTTEGQGPNAIPSLTGGLDPILLGFHAEGGLAWPYRLAQFGMDDPIRASMQSMARTVRLICLKRVKSRTVCQLYRMVPGVEIISSLFGGVATMMISTLIGSNLNDHGFNLSGLWVLPVSLLPGSFFLGRWLSRFWRVKRGGIKVIRPLLREKLNAIRESAAAQRILAAGA